MKCQMCGRNPATTHIKTLVNGAVGEYSLCAECARRLGYRNLFADLSRGLELLGRIIPARRRRSNVPAAQRFRILYARERLAVRNATGRFTISCFR